MVSRRTLLASGAAVAASCVRAAPDRNQRPNIVFIMADDLGYADLSCYGRRDYQTPAIDALARQGVRYLHAYANSPVCSATRTALMTGQYQYRLPVGLEEPIAFRNVGLPPAHPTLPSVLRDHGYATALVGKWHLGAPPAYGPLKSGYDHFWGYRGGGIDYFTHEGPFAADLWDGETAIEEDGYLTDLLGSRAVDMVARLAGGGRPFMLSLHFSAPHWPWTGPDDEAESRRLASSVDRAALLHWDGGGLETYAAIVRRMDREVGRVLNALEEAGVEDNTIVIFTSDNGGERYSDVWPFSGRKTELLEGGIRVPCIVRWPGRFKAGETSEDVIISMDWAPTLAAAGGAAMRADHPPDGVDVFSADGESLRERTLFWRYRHLEQRACRAGKWKYLKIAGNEFLFDIIADPLERANLKLRFPEKFDQLRAEYAAWESHMLPIDPEAYSHGFSGREMADRYGAPAPENKIPGHVPALPRAGD